MLNLDGNQFWGPLPPELGALTSLEILDLSKNDFSGAIPTEAGLWTNLGRYLEENVVVCRKLLLTVALTTFKSDSETA